MNDRWVLRAGSVEGVTVRMFAHRPSHMYVFTDRKLRPQVKVDMGKCVWCFGGVCVIFPLKINALSLLCVNFQR